MSVTNGFHHSTLRHHVTSACGISATQVPSVVTVRPQYPVTNSNVESASVRGHRKCPMVARTYLQFTMSYWSPSPRTTMTLRFSVTHQTTQPSYDGHSPIPTRVHNTDTIRVQNSCEVPCSGTIQHVPGHSTRARYNSKRGWDASAQYIPDVPGERNFSSKFLWSFAAKRDQVHGKYSETRGRGV